MPHPPRAVGRVSGVGMNAAELERNAQLTDSAVRDLNRKPTLPYADATFDLVTMTVPKKRKKRKRKKEKNL